MSPTANSPTGNSSYANVVSRDSRERMRNQRSALCQGVKVTSWHCGVSTDERNVTLTLQAHRITCTLNVRKHLPQCGTRSSPQRESMSFDSRDSSSCWNSSQHLNRTEYLSLKLGVFLGGEIGTAWLEWGSSEATLVQNAQSRYFAFTL